MCKTTLTQTLINVDSPADNEIFFFKICESSGIVSKYHYRYTIKYNKPRKSVDVGKQLTGSLEIKRTKRLRQEKYKL